MWFDHKCSIVKFLSYLLLPEIWRVLTWSFCTRCVVQPLGQAIGASGHDVWCAVISLCGNGCLQCWHSTRRAAHWLFKWSAMSPPRTMAPQPLVHSAYNVLTHLLVVLNSRNNEEKRTWRLQHPDEKVRFFWHPPPPPRRSLIEVKSLYICSTKHVCSCISLEWHRQRVGVLLSYINAIFLPRHTGRTCW